MPGSRGVCFVCGSLGAELHLHSKPREQGPYFPFLEHHEPPKASRLPGPDGVVDSCRVCYAFLSQQWETYERSKTPAIKRLYWLKRTDELTFTGAEMKLQGEYMAQVMGLQYQPNCHDNCSNAPISPDDCRVGSSGYNAAGGGVRDGGTYPGGSLVHDGGGTGGITSGRPRSRHSASVDHAMVAHMQAAEPEGALDLTVASKSMESNAKVHSSAGRPSAGGFRDLIVCYTCACEMYVMNSKVVSSARISASEPYFPFLEKMTAAKGSVPLSSQGLTRVCEPCFASLCQQWLAYERACTPRSARIYKIKDKYFDVSHSQPLHQPSVPELPPEVNKARVRAEEACYLCGQVRPQNQICPLYTVPPADKKVQMYFPFIRELRRPHGAQPLNPDGTVLVCTTCNSNLQAQWQHYEAESVPLMHRRYSLLPVSSAPMSIRVPDTKNCIPMTDSPRVGGQRRKSGEGRSEGVDVHQPLNIHISKSPVLSSSGSAHGLLAIAPQTPRSITGDVSSASIPGLVLSEMAASGLNSRPSDLPRGTGLTSASAGSITSVPHPLQQAANMPKKVCFLCGEQCLLSKVHLLYSYPVRHEAKSAANAQSVPFFPFLANREPAAGSDPMTDEGTVISCNYCYHSLISQWKDFEDSKNPADSNRWLRKYSVRDFVCYVCGVMVSRRKIRTLEVHKFHFLKEHKAPLSALVLDAGEAVAACDSCAFSLAHQFAEYERMGVPMDLRKYNWTTAPVSEENSQDNSDQSGAGEERWRRMHFSNEDSSHSVTETVPDGDDSAVGLGHVSKPPALSMLSPASGKMTPKTATVPPLSQASPSNGLTTAGSNSALNATRTSSFAAALRKLAHQAKDPQEEAAALAAAAKHNGSPINSTSPRSTTPKRAPPPLVYSGHNASLSSPPVVTIAPTQSLNLSNDGRQSNDRVPSAHSTASSYDPYTMKHDRDQRPHSSHSRDDDRASVKDSLSLPQTPTRLVPPQSTAATSREESIARGFHPYRPEDDLHRAAAAAAAALPPPFGLDPAYVYHPAFLQPHPYSHPALRFEDPLLLERYRLMQASPFLPFPHPGLVPHPGVHPLLSGARYPAELLHQYPYISPGAQGMDHRSPQVAQDRSKSEDDRVRDLEREREKEKREKEREREREREREAESIKREKLREAERDREKHREHGDRRDILTVPSRYLNDREVEHRDARSRHHHHPRDDSCHSGKGGSISHGTPRDSESSRSRLLSSGGSHDKNHISSHSSHNHYHKYDNHLLPKDRGPPESSHPSYHNNSHGEAEQSKGQPPPPLISPHRSSSKGSGEGAIFRPFEKEGPSNGASAAVSLTRSDKTQDILSVPPLHLSSTGSDKCNGGSSAKSRKDSSGVYSQQSSAVRVFGSTVEAKIINSNYINHRVERFDFKSLARECTTGAGDSGKLALSTGSEDVAKASLQPPPLASLPETVSPVVSKLDLKEKRLREARTSETYNSDSEDTGDSDEEEDRKRERLTVVDSALPMDLELTPGKLGLMDALGLSTLQQKKDLQCQLFRKRRRSMRERSVSPIEMEDGELCDIDQEELTLSSPNIDPASLCLEPDYAEKSQFLSVLGLILLSPEHRKELEAIRCACENCKRRCLEKRKNRQLRKDTDAQPENDVLVALGQSKNNKRKFDEVDQSSNSLDHTIEPLRITLGQLQERHLAASRQQQNHVHFKLGADSNRPIIFPESQNRQLSREFAEQFHESVLQSTRQKELSQKSGHTKAGEGLSNDSALRFGQDSNAKLHLSNDHLHSHSARSGDGPHPVYPWPGIEEVFESYLRHREEERMEAQVLLERCRQLHAEKSELHNVAESLNQRMRVLHQELAARDAERQQTQSAIDSLKKCLRIYR